MRWTDRHPNRCSPACSAGKRLNCEGEGSRCKQTFSQVRKNMEQEVLGYYGAAIPGESSQHRKGVSVLGTSPCGRSLPTPRVVSPGWPEARQQVAGAVLLHPDGPSLLSHFQRDSSCHEGFSLDLIPNLHSLWKDSSSGQLLWFESLHGGTLEFREFRAGS